jgi:hypothetical protein
MPNDRIVVVDGSGSIDDVHARVWGAYVDACGGS